MFSLRLALITKSENYSRLQPSGAKIRVYLYRLNLVLPDLVKIDQVCGSSALIF